MTQSRLDIDMDYSSVSDYKIKKLLMMKMQEFESIHYIAGWLEMCYLNPCDAASERSMAIRELIKYNGMVKK